MGKAESSIARRSKPIAVSGPAAPEFEASWRVNDLHSRLNATQVTAIRCPDRLKGLSTVVHEARRDGLPICIAGGRHAMGGQQFVEGGMLVDMAGLNRVVRFDAENGLIEVEAGMQWPELIDWLIREQEGGARQWGIAQKQTGADRLSIGGALAANIHGRGLSMPPFIADIEAFTLIDATGALRHCSREENWELFRLAIGGYGLFGLVATVTLRLVPRTKLRREVELADIDDLMPLFEDRIAEGFLYGDFQFSTDPQSPGFLRRGVLSAYRPVDPATPIPQSQKALSEADWTALLHLAHSDRGRAFDLYTAHYLSTSGQIYWSDTHQLGTYVDGYHEAIDRQTGAQVPSTEMITEIYVPRPALGAFMSAVRQDFRDHGVDFIYGTVRLIEADTESVLAWARAPWVCVIFNLCVEHSRDGLAKAESDFRRLIDRGLEFGGGYYLTYHRWADAEQVVAAHPRMPEFLAAKRQHDPEERFQSDWYRHHRAMFRGEP